MLFIAAFLCSRRKSTLCCVLVVYADISKNSDELCWCVVPIIVIVGHFHHRLTSSCLCLVLFPRLVCHPNSLAAIQ